MREPRTSAHVLAPRQRPNMNKNPRHLVSSSRGLFLPSAHLGGGRRAVNLAAPFQQLPRRVVDLSEPVRAEVHAPVPPAHHHAHVRRLGHLQHVQQPTTRRVLSVLVVVLRPHPVGLVYPIRLDVEVGFISNPNPRFGVCVSVNSTG